MSEYTPEPWEIETIRFKDDGHEGWISAFNFHYANGTLGDWRGLAMTFGDDSAEGKRECTANARRIVACVNACAGMIDPAAEIAKLWAEREALLLAAKALRGSLHFERNTEQVKQLTMAAIALAEKGE